MARLRVARTSVIRCFTRRWIRPLRQEGGTMAQAAATPSPSGGSVSTTAVQKLPLFALTTMVVGSMVGAGIFSLPRAFGTATGPFGAIVAWTIAAGGMYTLARVFQALAERKPDLDAGVYAYAKAGFRRLSRVPVCSRLFDQRLPRKYLLLGSDQIDARRFFPDLRQRRHARRDRRSPRSASGSSTSRCCAGFSRPPRSTRSSRSPRSCRSCCSS